MGLKANVALTAAAIGAVAGAGYYTILAPAMSAFTGFSPFGKTTYQFLRYSQEFYADRKELPADRDAHAILFTDIRGRAYELYRGGKTFVLTSLDDGVRGCFTENRGTIAAYTLLSESFRIKSTMDQGLLEIVTRASSECQPDLPETPEKILQKGKEQHPIIINALKGQITYRSIQGRAGPTNLDQYGNRTTRISFDTLQEYVRYNGTRLPEAINIETTLGPLILTYSDNFLPNRFMASETMVNSKNNICTAPTNEKVKLWMQIASDFRAGQPADNQKLLALFENSRGFCTNPKG